MSAVLPALDGAAGAVDPFDFSYADALPTRPAGRGRLVEGRALAGADPGAPRFLFVPGGYHGAWCYAHFLRACDALGIPAGAVEMRGHGALAGDPALARAGLRDLADDVAAACASSGPATLLVGHSLGGLLAPLAAERVASAGLGLLAPSPPGSLAGARPVAPVPEDGLAPPPAGALARERFLGGQSREGEERLFARLRAESARALNERYRLAVPVDPTRLPKAAICLSAGLDSPERHPPGQDAAVAAFYGAEHHHLPDSPHGLMYGPDWPKALALLIAWRARLAPG